MTEETKLIMKKLDAIKSELDYIKGHLVDADLIVTDDDLEALEEAEKDRKAGKTKRLT
ncbi:hypothetical protein HYS48_00005 [Candidatus Woesearchaeota archaeon]|nr:hypothetical protein [Candidatus Woesearchaeota archaeon]